jgi:hypothetical protein
MNSLKRSGNKLACKSHQKSYPQNGSSEHVRRRIPKNTRETGERDQFFFEFDANIHRVQRILIYAILLNETVAAVAFIITYKTNRSANHSGRSSTGAAINGAEGSER